MLILYVGVVVGGFYWYFLLDDYIFGGYVFVVGGVMGVLGF